MARHRSSLATAIVATLLLGACQPDARSSAVPTTSTPPAATGTSAPSNPTAPSASPVAASTPDPSAVVCPAPLPTTLTSTDELADPSCYGTAALTIDGWLNEGDVTNYLEGGSLPTWTLSFSELSSTRPRVTDYVYDFLLSDGLGGLPLVTKPDSGIDLADLGRWVRIQGHYNDPEVLACQRMVPPESEDEAMPDCHGLFLVTALEALPAAVPACPVGSPIALADYMTADAACFIGREVEITGWEDIGEGFGGVNPTYSVVLPPSLDFLDAQLTQRRWEDGDPGYVIFPWRLKGSGVRFDRADRKVVVTAELGHPVSQECRPEVFDTWTWSPPVSWAQHRCEHLLVITGVRDRG